MKTVKPLLTIGIFALIDIAVKCIVSAGESNTAVTLTLEKNEQAVLTKLDMDKDSLINAINALSFAGLADVEEALKPKNDDTDWKETDLFAVNDLAFKKKGGADIKNLNELGNQAEKNAFKEAVGKTVAAVRKAKQETALGKIGLTAETLKDRVKANLAKVEKALTDDKWDELMTALKAKVKNQQNPLKGDDQDHIKVAVGKALTAVAWTKVGLKDGQLKKFATLNITAAQLKKLKWAEAAMEKYNNVTAQTKALNLPPNVKVSEWEAMKLTRPQLEAFGTLKSAEEFEYMLEAAKLTVTGAANGIYLSTAVMLAPLAAWYLF